MADDLFDKLGDLLKKKPWYELPRLLADGRLVQMRTELRKKNLHDTEEPAEPRQEIPANLDPAVRNERSIDGTHNDLHFPKMGAVGRRFGRNFALEHTFPDTAKLLIPNPRVVSRELMTRDTFKPATILNLVAGAWLQFMVHDWFVHARSKTEFIDIPTPPGDDYGEPNVRVPRSVPDAAPAGSKRPPAYANLNSHWWDASQIYGADAETAAKAADEDRRQAPARADRPASDRSRNGPELYRIHRQLVDRARHAPHAVHAGAQLPVRPARARAPGLERRPALRAGHG